MRRRCPMSRPVYDSGSSRHHCPKGQVRMQHGAADLQSNGKFDQAFCIILDINLGHGSGIELRHHLAVAGVTVPIIYITGNYSEATRMAAIESGCLAYLTKPFTATSLIEAVENASTIFA